MSEEERELEKLKLLFDYTKFHIGLYATVATIFGALIAAEKAPININPTLLFLSILFICVAGVAGGLVASSIPGYGGYKEFWQAKISPYWWPFRELEPKYWTYIEHTAFWIAVFLAILAVGLRQPSLNVHIYLTGRKGAQSRSLNGGKQIKPPAVLARAA